MTSHRPASTSREVQLEQARVDVMYARLDELRATVDERLRQVRRAGPSGTHQNRSERDAFAGEYERRLAQLWSVEERLAFGRLDLTDATTRYIGRIGLSDDDQRQLLVDWRADAAADFYRATAVEPGDVVRRRHLAMRQRIVTGVEDEVFDLDRAMPSQGSGERLVLSGEGALLAALAEHRTGRMKDIVSTIQGEQDRIIRAPLDGVLVVQGGPGTGKTAVALHRAAYLLYQHRARLASHGVLVIGPSPVFLRYIEQVLPSLGESAAVMMTAADFYPGVDPVDEPDPRVSRLKGDVRLAEVLRSAVRALQRVPEAPVTLAVEGTTITLDPTLVRRARDRARYSGRPHNAARESFVRQVLDGLAFALGQALGFDDPGDHREALLEQLRDAKDVRREVNLCWMPSTPERLLARLYASPTMLGTVGAALSAEERERLLRPDDGVWTLDDIPLLDELASLLGVDESSQRADAQLAAAQRASEIAFARSALETSGLGSGIVTAEMLAERFSQPEDALTVAERAHADRTWTYGHVVVDEAQELSGMAWRAVLRRCPSRSMTVVGDVNQASGAGATLEWQETMDRVAPGRWRMAELTVNYRTPAEITAVAQRVLTDVGVPVRAQLAARHGTPPVVRRFAAIDVPALAHVVAGELEAVGAGQVAVIFPRRGYEQLAAALHENLTGHPVPGRRDLLDDQLVTISAGDAKGLEFDSVVVVEPDEFLGPDARGAGDLYVAMTRSTQRLTVVYSHDLPRALTEGV